MSDPQKIMARPEVMLVERLTDDIVHLVLREDEIARRARPGQFLALRASETDAPLLRRPFSLAKVEANGCMSIVFRIVGTGTRLLAGKRPGERLDVIGPLGTPFEIRSDRPIFLVGGGLGIPPIVYLAHELQAAGVNARFYCGVQTQEELAVLLDAADCVSELLVSTDDGSAGHHGFVTELVERDIGEGDRMYACGPRPLLNVLLRIARDRNIPTQLSFEQQMACGVGACMGCTIETARGYQRVCSDGPVFPAEYFFDSQP